MTSAIEEELLLHEAIRRNAYEALLMLLDAGFNPNHTPDGVLLPIEIALAGGQIKEVYALIEHGAKLYVTSSPPQASDLGNPFSEFRAGQSWVKSIAQGKRYNEALLTDRQLDHGLFVGFAPAENPEIAIATILENSRGGSAATALARPILDYWLLNKNKKPIRPSAAQVSGGLMTAGLKPSELPSGEVPSSTAPNTNNVNNPNTATNHPALNPNPSQTTPSSAPTNPPATAPTAVVPTNPIESD